MTDAAANPRPDNDAAAGPMRLARFLAAAGIASRRHAEELIRAGRVTVNGAVVATPACVVEAGRDRVTFDGREIGLPARPPLCLMLNKPPGYTCSAADPHAGRLIGELLPADAGRLFSIGRLDRDSEGLILCTNDGELAQLLMHPRHGIPKTYLVWVEGRIRDQACDLFRSGVHNNGEFLRAESVRIVNRTAAATVLELVLCEGRKREIRRMCAAAGMTVLRLQRIRIGTLALGDLESGRWRALTPAEIAGLRAAAQPAAPPPPRRPANGNFRTAPWSKQ